MNELAVFDEVRANMALLKKENANLVFDYEDFASRKEAKSHVFKLRKTKTAIGDVHKKAKANALAVCKSLDGEKRVLIAEVEEMIDIHANPIKEVEDRVVQEAAAKAEVLRLERERVEQERLDAIRKQEEENARKAEELRKAEEAHAAKIKAEEDRLAREKEKLEAEKRAEVEAKRREAEARKQAVLEKEEELRQHDLRLEREKQEALAQAERDKQAAIEAAKQAHEKVIAEAKAKENARLAKEAAAKAEQIRLAEIERRRVENEDNKNRVQGKIFIQINNLIKDAVITTAVVDAIAKGKIDNLTINY